MEQTIKAVVFDMDGTLYHPLRMLFFMSVEWFVYFCVSPWKAVRVLRAVRAYRKALEQIRGEKGVFSRQIQLQTAGAISGMGVDEIDLIVARWFEEKPLRHIARCARKNLRETVGALLRQNVRVGVYSDYYAEKKCLALGIGGNITFTLGGEDVGFLKPNRAGFDRVSILCKCEPSQIVYVGDRVSVDAVGARTVGMRVIILGGNFDEENRDVLFASDLSDALRLIQNLK